MIREISKSIISSSKNEEFLQVESINGVKWLQENCPEAYQLFTQFLERHGHRGLRELEYATKTWSMEPEKVIEMVQTTLKVGLQEVKAKEINFDTILSQLKTKLSSRGKYVLRKVISRYHKAIQLREESKSRIIQGKFFNFSLNEKFHHVLNFKKLNFLNKIFTNF